MEPGENNIFLAHQLLVVEPLFFERGTGGSDDRLVPARSVLPIARFT
ncbi:MAG: hypothetical protein ABSF89_02510 [Acidimicrobiales bacterium]